MTHEPVIQWLQRFGGAYTTRPPGKRGHKMQFEWRINRQLDVQMFLTAVLPFMQVKHSVAEDALTYLASRQPMHHDGRLGQHTDGRPSDT